MCHGWAGRIVPGTGPAADAREPSAATRGRIHRMELRGRTALLTGAAGGIGSAIAKRLAEDGMRVVLSGRDEPALETLRASLPGDGHAVVVADLALRADVDSLIAKAEAAAGGPLDLLVNNAGLEASATYHRLAPEDVTRMIDVNLTAPMLLTHAVIPGMLERGRGHVVQISSVAGLVGTACGEPYSATKAGLIGFSESLRATYADTPVGFSTVCPGFTTGGGMYARMAADGYTSNALLGTTTVEKVAAAVADVVVRDRPRAIVNGRPMAPIAALVTLTPGIGARLVERTGGNAIFRRLAADREHG